MSGLPIMSPLNNASLALRDSAAALLQTPPQNTAATVRTLTASAVQQARGLDATDPIPRKALPTAIEKRSRLIGPPPTFEVNVLQHLRETRFLPEAPDTPPPTEAKDLPIQAQDASASPDQPEDAVKAAKATANTPPAYLERQQIGGVRTNTISQNMDISV